MKINKTTLGLLALGISCVSAPSFALEAWSGQTATGETPIEVIFNGNIYRNAYWVGADNCPLNDSGDANSGKAWHLVRAASAQEIKTYGNPTTCKKEEAAGEEKKGQFDATRAYAKGETLVINEVNYRAITAVVPNSFAPGESNPWELYQPTSEWKSGKDYQTGNVVKIGDEFYKAAQWSRGSNPSDVNNQSHGHDGKLWFVLGKVKEPTAEQLTQATELIENKHYEQGALIKFKNKNYIASRITMHGNPDTLSPWKAYIEWKGVKDLVGRPLNPWPAHVFAPYIDFGRMSTDIPDMAAMVDKDKVNHFVLAFIVNKDGAKCMPHWGGGYPLQNYPQYSKIKALRAKGGDVMVSFGGVTGVMLATSCDNVNDLKQYYSDTVDNLNLNALDFDIEGENAAIKESYHRRNTALAELQAQWKEEGKDVSLWFTVAVLPEGMTNAKDIIKDADEQGVKLSGLNLMTMDYGDSACPPSQGIRDGIQGKCSTDAVDSVYKQVKDLQMFKGLSKQEIYARLGTTPMIGQNDAINERLFPHGAEMVLKHAEENSLGLVSMWSLIRDKSGVDGDLPSGTKLSEEVAPTGIYTKIFAPFTKTTPLGGEHRVTAHIAKSPVSNGESDIVLDGSKSQSRDGTPLSYKWVQISGPTVSLKNADQSSAAFSVARPVVTHHYRFALTVSNAAAGTEDTTETTITVDNKQQQVKPTITLEKSYSVDSGKSLSITAKAADFYGEALAYQWTIPEGITVIGQTDGPTIDIIAPTLAKSANYGLGLRVTNVERKISSDAETVLAVKVVNVIDFPAWDATKSYGGKCNAVSYKGQIWYNAFWTGAGVVPGVKPDVAGSEWRTDKQALGCK